MDKFLLPRSWISFCLVFPVELEEKDYVHESTKEQDNGFGTKIVVTTISKGKGTVRKETGISCGPYQLDIFSKVYGSSGESDGVRIELQGWTFMGTEHGKQTRKSWNISGGIEMFSGETTVS
ncbi:conserved hypothetical protein [Lausannevirus]|uniref:Uncharacterized protein n=1 Tax=Lausannevirus TaxID=999883 RepID=F2WLA7_9VIRU|nr:hypothetical protein LAU_0179 [Lausannevirus]AEA07030.1 conserved hypothetical protein [Lausannevirus]